MSNKLLEQMVRELAAQRLMIEELQSHEVGVGGVVTDHGSLTGLGDDDHAQYHNNARGDARYYTEAELDAGQLDGRYFTETEHLDVSAGAGDAGKPIKLNASGQVDASMLSGFASIEVRKNGIKVLDAMVLDCHDNLNVTDSGGGVARIDATGGGGSDDDAMYLALVGVFR